MKKAGRCDANVRERNVKGLRYNLAKDKPSAAGTLLSQPQPVGLYIVLLSADGDYETALNELIASRPEVDAWIWRMVDGEMLPLPVPGSHGT